MNSLTWCTTILKTFSTLYKLNRSFSYYALLLLLIASLAGSCGKSGPTLNRRESLSRKDKIPYGTYYAYENLNYIFPYADIEVNSSSPDKGNNNIIYSDHESASEPAANKIANIFISSTVRPNTAETEALLRMVGEGQHVFISGLFIGEALLDSLRLKVEYDLLFGEAPDSLTVSIKNPVTRDSLSFTYPGLNQTGHIVEMDTSITTILGKDEQGLANFVQFSYTGGGALYLHLAPVAFSNFFLLHKNNKAYYDNAMSYMPRSVKLVKWDEYFRRTGGGKSDGPGGGGGGNRGKNALSWLTKQKEFAAALSLLVLLLLLIFVFESKRKQRMIPIVPPVKNASLDFVKTIGRLYYQRRDNKNLAQKMTAHFLDQVRSRYNIRTGIMDEEFEKRLAWKSGYDIAVIKDVLYYMRYVQDEHTVTDEQLLTLNTKLEKFYSLSA
jgi:hypothetical protein